MLSRNGVQTAAFDFNFEKFLTSCEYSVKDKTPLKSLNISWIQSYITSCIVAESINLADICGICKSTLGYRLFSKYHRRNVFDYLYNCRRERVEKTLIKIAEITQQWEIR